MPVLMGQHFHYVGSPNWPTRVLGTARLGVETIPTGLFVDWNPAVLCEVDRKAIRFQRRFESNPLPMHGLTFSGSRHPFGNAVPFGSPCAA